MPPLAATSAVLRCGKRVVERFIVVHDLHAIVALHDRRIERQRVTPAERARGNTCRLVICQAMQEFIAHRTVFAQEAHGVPANLGFIVHPARRNASHCSVEHVRSKRRGNVVGFA